MSRRVLLYAPFQAEKETDAQTPLEALYQAASALAEPSELARRTAQDGSLDYLLCADVPQAFRLLVMGLPEIRQPMRQAFDEESELFGGAGSFAPGERAPLPQACGGHTEAIAGLDNWWSHLKHEVDRWILLARQEAQLRDLVADAIRHGAAEFDAAGNVIGIHGADEAPA